MWVSRSELRRILEQVKVAEARATAAESALALERKGNRQSERESRTELRHFASMWLRSNRSLPLPKTAEEKEEAKVEAQKASEQPIPLTDLQLAMRDANRKEAAKFGKTQEEADKDFVREFLNFNEMME